MLPTGLEVNNLEMALAYAAQGYRVFPLKLDPGTDEEARKRRKEPDGILVPNGHNGATTDAATIRRWWTASPDAGIGCATGGPQRLYVMDSDTAVGAETLAGLEARLGDLPRSRHSMTRRGYHIYTTYPEGVELRNTESVLGGCVDTRGEGGFIILPSGANDSRWLSEGPPSPLPVPWLDALLALKPAPFTGPVGDPEAFTGVVTPRARKMLQKWVKAVLEAALHTRNSTLNNAAVNVGHYVGSGEIGEAEVWLALRDAATKVGLGDSEIDKTIRSGLTKGISEPKVRDIRMKAAGAKFTKPPKDRIFSEGGPKADPASEWESRLLYNEKGHLSNNLRNAVLLLTYAPEWAGVFTWDVFASRYRWARTPPLPDLDPAVDWAGTEISDSHVTWIHSQLSENHGVSFAREVIEHAYQASGEKYPSHSLGDGLRKLQWDGVPRVDTWLETYLGADGNHPLTAVISRKWLISACARALTPGVEAHHMMVLEGPQGCGKSTAAKIIAGEFHLDSLHDLHTREKDAIEQLQGTWVVEMAELSAMRRADVELVKGFVGRCSDRYRGPWWRVPKTLPRSVVFIGTTNAAQYLHDPTGARRFWPVKVRQCDFSALIRDRDQLLAEAVVRYLAKEAFHPTTEEEVLFAAAAAERYDADAFEPAVERWCEQRIGDITIGAVLEEALRIEPKGWTRGEQTRIGNILLHLGYVSRQVRRDGVRVRIYEKG